MTGALWSPAGPQLKPAEGTFWRAALILPITGGIPSEEAFGVPLIRINWFLGPTGIPSEEVVGTPTVKYDQTVTLGAGIPSSEVFGDPLIQIPRFINPAGIASAEAFGTPQFNMQIDDSTGIASSEAFGTPTITTGNVNIVGSGIASSEAFGTPTVIVNKVWKSVRVPVAVQRASTI